MAEARQAAVGVSLSRLPKGRDAETAVPLPYAPATAALRERCPALVEVGRWEQCIADAETFTAQWGEQAAALGWTVRDLFGLHKVPARPHPSYRRLSRYEQPGLVWLLEGRPVVALTESTAAISSPSGTIAVYRKDNKPPVGPFGDSLDDFEL